MGIALPLIIGFIASAIGILLPGLVNMTAAKISMRDGRQRAVVFALGAVSVIFIQTYIAVSFAKFINRRPDIIGMLEEIGFGIFALLTIYFLVFAGKKKPKVEEDVVKLRSRTGNFFLGTLLSSLNFFPIPYYVFASITLSTYNYFFFTHLFVFLFVVGAAIGAFSAFYLYIIFFKKLRGGTAAAFFLDNANYLIGGITGIVAIITLIKILRNE